MAAALQPPARPARDARLASTRLEETFANLSDDQKYEALLLGAVAPGGDSRPDIDGALALVDEMAAKNVGSVGPRVLSALVDAAATRRDADVVGKVLRLSRRSGGARRYASQKTALTLPPSDATLFKRALEGAPDVPADDRAAEISAALAAGGVVVLPALFVFASGPLGFDALPEELWLVLATALAGLDVTQNGGAVTSKVGDGFDRLLSSDPRRDAECEAASFATAYWLGLPCFPFSPSALEAADLLEDGDADEGTVHALLVWLLSGVAAERRKHRKLVSSDPRQANAFLALLRSRGLASPGDDGDRVRWALKDATALQAGRVGALEGLADFFESGAATAGDVVSRLESE